MSSLRTHTPNIVVVGAGLSGLIAARDLLRSGHEVVVLEAADRVGGRVLTQTSSLGSRLDLGGQWIGADHRRVMALAEEYGQTPFRRRARALPGIVDGNRRVRWLSVTALGAGAASAALCVIAALAPPEWSNRQSLGALIRRSARGRARRLISATASVSWTADLDRISLYGVRRLVRAQHGLGTILSAAGGAQDSLLLRGVGAITDRVAEELGERVRTGERVVALRQDAAGVSVQTSRTVHRAAKVVVAMPPPSAAAIRYEPPLPTARRRIAQATRMGTVYKAIAVYDRPFWRERGVGDVLFLHEGGGAVFDTTPPDGPGHLCILVGGAHARALDSLSADERAARILGPLVAHYGTEITRPASWHEKAWHRDPDVQGGYIALPTPGTIDGFLPLSASAVGHLHWAGSETALEHPGYLDGAIEAGQRVAEEVADILRP